MAEIAHRRRILQEKTLPHNAAHLSQHSADLARLAQTFSMHLFYSAAYNSAQRCSKMLNLVVDVGSSSQVFQLPDRQELLRETLHIPYAPLHKIHTFLQVVICMLINRFTIIRKSVQ